MTDTPKLNAVNYHVVYTGSQPLYCMCAKYENYCILFHP